MELLLSLLHQHDQLFIPIPIAHTLYVMYVLWNFYRACVLPLETIYVAIIIVEAFYFLLNHFFVG